MRVGRRARVRGRVRRVGVRNRDIVVGSRGWSGWWLVVVGGVGAVED